MSALKKPRVCVTRRLPEVIEKRLGDLYEVIFNPSDIPMTSVQLREAMQVCDVLVPTVTDKIDQSLLASAGDQLKLIANFGAGVDHIDVDTARQHNIIVTNTPGVLTADTADMTLALILAVNRGIAHGIKLLENNQWTGWSPTGLLGSRVSGKRLGIIGMGRIGQAVAERARAFGMEINYHNRKRLQTDIEERLSAHYWESLDQMLATMDVVSVNCPHTPATFHLLSARRLSLMKPTACLINTARGEIVDEGALIRMLEKKQLAGIGLDVFEKEPQINPRLLKLPNAVLLPHMASATIESREEMGQKVILSIQTYADGHMPSDRVLSNN
jgi:glyoxylate reductase